MQEITEKKENYIKILIENSENKEIRRGFFSLKRS